MVTLCRTMSCIMQHAPLLIRRRRAYPVYVLPYRPPEARMVYHTSGSLLTADEFVLHPAANDRTELVRGAVHVMAPVILVHGLLSLRVGRLLSTYVLVHRLGECFGD